MKIITLNKKDITDFAKERNLLLTKSDEDWNLFLDSDEKLSMQIKNVDNNKTAFYLYRKNYFLGSYVGTDKIIRLVKKNSGKWVRSVHEVWQPNDINSVGILKYPFIIHNTASSLKDYINKLNLYSTLHAMENNKESKRSSVLKIIFFPICKFIVTFIKSKNVVFSIMQSLHSYLSWSKLYFGQY